MGQGLGQGRDLLAVRRLARCARPGRPQGSRFRNHAIHLFRYSTKYK
jgi:hypothetical protein